MPSFSFADRYAEALLSPGGAAITARQGPADRIVKGATAEQILDLVGLYYDTPRIDATWMRDEFAKDDPGFSLVNNEREGRVLAAVMLGALVEGGNSVAILAVVAGGVSGHRTPTVAAWLQGSAADALRSRAVSDRELGKLEPKVSPPAATKLAAEIAALSQNDWTALTTLLGKVHVEQQAAERAIATQATNALSELTRRLRYQREEVQMLWWLTGGYSRSLDRSFATLAPMQAALVGAVDLGDLTTTSRLGPVAAPAMLDRVIAMAGAPAHEGERLAAAVDGLAAGDSARLNIAPDAVPARLAPVTAALALARQTGLGAWHARFAERVGLDPIIAFTPPALAQQLYLEHLLGQIL